LQQHESSDNNGIHAALLMTILIQVDVAPIPGGLVASKFAARHNRADFIASNDVATANGLLGLSCCEKQSF